MLALPPSFLFGCSFLASTLEIASRLSEINAFLAPRGPDHTSLASFGPFHTVHNLLSLTGAPSPQPFLSPDNRTLALFNGEIYNYQAIHTRIAPASPLYPSDGHCILDAYTAWGESFTSRLRGEFAIVVIDLSARRVVVSTDPFGIKPLFLSSGEHFGVSSYKSGLARAGHSAITQLSANTAYVYSIAPHAEEARAGRFTLLRQHKLVTWDLSPRVGAAEEWEVAFEAAVAARTRGVRRGIFLALSSGYDSGAIHLAMLRLGVPHSTYSIVGAEGHADQQLMRERIEYARSHGPLNTTSHLLRVDPSSFKATRDLLQAQCEKYTYHLPTWSKSPRLSTPAWAPSARVSTVKMGMLSDSAAIGVGHICSLARKAGLRVMLTGSGADETMTDYGFNGVRWSSQSQFGGYWPSQSELARIFPWESFYNGSQRNYLAKDEYVTGTYGVEGRFPFLDVKVVQAQLSIPPSLKNTYYKAAIQLYLKKYGYPYQECVATKEQPFGVGTGCKKLGFLVPKRPRKAGATSGCIGPACASSTLTVARDDAPTASATPWTGATNRRLLEHERDKRFNSSALVLGMYSQQCEDISAFLRACIGCSAPLTALLDSAQSAAECERLHASTRGQYYFVHVERVLSQETLQLHSVARVRIMFQKTRALFSLMLVRSPGARWYVKVDTDTILNLPQLAIQLEGLSRPADYIGKQISLFSYRANQSKVWYMQGGMYALSNRAATAMRSCPLGSWMNCPDKVLRDSNHNKDKQAVATGSCYSEGTLNRDDLYAGMCMREAGMISHNLRCALSMPREALQTHLSKLGMGEASRSASLMKQRRAIVQSHARQCSCPVSLHPLKSDDKLQDAKTLLLYMCANKPGRRRLLTLLDSKES